MKKVNYGLAKCDYTHWIIICTIDRDSKLTDNQIKTGLEHLYKISISKCKEIPAQNGRRRVLIDVATQQNYNYFVELFAKQSSFWMQGQTIYLSGQGISEDIEQVKRLVVFQLKGKLATQKEYQNNHNLFISEQRNDFQINNSERTDEFTELYKSLKNSSSRYESDLKNEVSSLLHSMYPSIFNTSNTTTQTTCLKTGITRKF